MKRAAESPPEDLPLGKEARLDKEAPPSRATEEKHELPVPPPTTAEIYAAGRIIDRAFEAALDKFEKEAKPYRFEKTQMGWGLRENYAFKVDAWIELPEYRRMEEALHGCDWWHWACKEHTPELIGLRMGGQITSIGFTSGSLTLWRDVYDDGDEKEKKEKKGEEEEKDAQ
jgi:hypothetical protein